MRDDEFEWDDNKADLNLVNHDISFEAARDAMNDPYILERLDDRMDYGEDRYVAYAMNNGTVLTISYVLRDERTRIITARKASRPEILRYDRNRTS